MALSVVLTGIDGFGGELWTFEPKWWDAAALFVEYRDRSRPAEPAPAWELMLQTDAARSLAQRFRPFLDHQRQPAAELDRLLQGDAKEIVMLLFEWSSE